ncbi:MAG: phenylalanine--tRNA ligase subunit beta [Flavobacteriia bacterium]|nr:phenylalanine--tRNA ligase subunit beta [Flavobacteriia bacterium]
MKVSYQWIKEWISTDLDVEKVAEILTDTGLEVESIEKIEQIKGSLEGVVVAEVVSCEKHPDADRLKVTTVNIGQNDVFQVVCGAPNVATGQKVLLATVGTTLYPNDGSEIKIKASKIRGVESQGMICAEDELGIGKSHEGILVLDKETIVGEKGSKIFNLESDEQIEIGLTPNRADALGIIGVARDLKAVLNVHFDKKIALKFPKIAEIEVVQGNHPHFSIEVNDLTKCPRYAGVLIRNVKIGESPQWLKNRIKSVGLNPISNIVDVTNFVMRELGTPLHAFDFNTLSSKIVVKTAQEGSLFTTLDGVERKLSSQDLMITNGSDYLAIAGVFGGKKSGITEKTTDIFIESAYFDSASIRKTAKNHSLSTDASFRYERGVDPELTITALQRAIYLITEIAGGKVDGPIVDIYPVKKNPKQVVFQKNSFKKLTGITIGIEALKQIIKELDIKILKESEMDFLMEIPLYRVDVYREVDVIEEILRIYGLQKIPIPEQVSIPSELNFNQNKGNKIMNSICNHLVSLGFYEVMNNSLNSNENLNFFTNNEKEMVGLLNPLSKELNSLRNSLLPGILQSIEFNQNRQQSDILFFEWGNIYKKIEEKYIENKHLFIALSGFFNKENWKDQKEKIDFFTAKGIALGIIEKLGLDKYIVEEKNDNSFSSLNVSIKINNLILMDIGLVHSSLKSHFDIKNDVFYIDVHWDNVSSVLNRNKTQYKEIPKTFTMRRDFSLLLDKNIPFIEIEKIAKKTDKKWLKNVSLFDVYEGDKLEKNKKSYAVSFIFQDDEKTLKDHDVDQIMNKIRIGLETELAAQLR